MVLKRHGMDANGFIKRLLAKLMMQQRVQRKKSEFCVTQLMVKEILDLVLVLGLKLISSVSHG
jgi:hypothetical protein